MGVASSIRGLRRLPVAKVLAAAEIALLAHDHVARLAPDERRRVLELLMAGRGRPRNLTAAQRAELHGLMAKADPRLFAGRVADKLSPVKLPNRVVRGKRQR
jgi:hypothetical protein